MVVKRFQVFAVLQAARASILGLPLESAHSWGLNRAIFVAAARYGFKGGKPKGSGGKTGAKAVNEYYLGDQLAYMADGKRLLFTIGGEVQTEAAFRKQVKSRFGPHFKEVWAEALDYVKTFDKDALLSGESFFGEVYRPRRDELAARWTELVGDQA